MTNDEILRARVGLLTVPERQRRAFLLMSSYGSTYGVVRRNGRDLYVADLAGWQDYSFRLGGVGSQHVPLNDAHRRVSQAALTAQVRLMESLYGRSRAAGPVH